MTEINELYTNNANCPLDYVEDILDSHNWVYSRVSNEEIFVDVAGKNTTYRLLFIWQAESNSLQICCHFEQVIAPDNYMNAVMSVSRMNASLWMGHFEIDPVLNNPIFRYTSLVRHETDKATCEYIEDLVEICLNQCERFSPVFELMTHDSEVQSDAMSLALMDTAGES